MKTVKENNKKKVSEEWLVIDKREDEISGCCCSIVNVSAKEEQDHVSRVLSKLRPFIPLSVEEASLTVNLENWTNCNVRLIGILKFDRDNNSYFLLSFKELGGMFRISLDFNNSRKMPLLNECIQIFGELKINFCGDLATPFLQVAFFRNMENGDLLKYVEAVEKMKPYIPLFIKSSYNFNRNCDNSSYDLK